MKYGILFVFISFFCCQASENQLSRSDTKELFKLAVNENSTNHLTILAITEKKLSIDFDLKSTLDDLPKDTSAQIDNAEVEPISSILLYDAIKARDPKTVGSLLAQLPNKQLSAFFLNLSTFTQEEHVVNKKLSSKRNKCLGLAALSAGHCLYIAVHAISTGDSSAPTTGAIVTSFCMSAYFLDQAKNYDNKLSNSQEIIRLLNNKHQRSTNLKRSGTL